MDANLRNFIPTEAETESLFEAFRQDPRLCSMFDELVQAHVACVACDDTIDLDEIRQMNGDELSLRVAENVSTPEPVVDTYLYELSELLWWKLSSEPREDEREPEDFWDELIRPPHEAGWVPHYTELNDRIAEGLHAIADNAKDAHNISCQQVSRQILSRLREDLRPGMTYCTADGFLLAMIDFIVSTYHWWEKA